MKTEQLNAKRGITQIKYAEMFIVRETIGLKPLNLIDVVIRAH
jgi:hypothetical protein